MNFGVEFIPVIYDTWKKGILKVLSPGRKDNERIRISKGVSNRRN